LRALFSAAEAIRSFNETLAEAAKEADEWPMSGRCGA
jgi:hypothetical protein